MSLLAILMPMYTLQFDGMRRSAGGDWPEPVGLLGYGWIIKRKNVEIARGYGVFLRIRQAGSSIAEYLALIDGLEALADLHITNEPIQIRGDAKCVIDQMSGLAGVSSPLTRLLYQRACGLSRRFAHLTWIWVPRRENSHADSLSRRSFQYLRYSPRFEREIKQKRSRIVYGGSLVPLVDLRLHSPLVQDRNI